MVTPSANVAVAVQNATPAIMIVPENGWSPTIWPMTYQLRMSARVRRLIAVFSPTTLLTAAKAVEQDEGPHKSHSAATNDQQRAHASSPFATNTLVEIPTIQIPIPTSVTLHDTVCSPTNRPMISAPATRLARSGTLSASTRRCSGFNRSIVAPSSSRKPRPASRLVGRSERRAAARALRSSSNFTKRGSERGKNCLANGEGDAHTFTQQRWW